MSRRVLRPVAVQLDGLWGLDGSALWFPAFTHGDHWNGFATPLFEKEVAERIVAAVRAKGNVDANYDPRRDAFVFRDVDDEEEEVFSAMDVDGRALYPIGSHAWTWTSNEAEN